MEEKHPEFEAILNHLAVKTFNRSRDGSKCVTCGSSKVASKDFDDDLSRKEFRISKMCQKCQDGIFCEDDDEEEV